jgi:hypothetical protein
MLDYYEFEQKLRDLARRADHIGLGRQDILEELVNLANEYLERAEDIELKAIVEMQMDPSNARYDWGL